MDTSTKIVATTISHIYNERKELAEDASLLEAINCARRQFEEASLPLIQPTVQPRSDVATAKKELIEAAVRKLGVEREFEAWMQARNEQSAKFYADDYEKKTQSLHGEYELPALLTRNIGEMWWAQTDIRSPAGLNARFEPDGAHLFGSLTWRDGDLWQGNLQAVGRYILDPSRMPSGGPGRFTSMPRCNLFGTLSAYTDGYWGDNWSKCWLHTAQVVRGGPAGAIIGEGHDHQNLYFLSQDDERAVRDLPGSMNFPRVDFNLDPAHNLVITLEIRFDFQLEGDSGVKFGVREIFRDAILQLFQWTIQRI